MNQNLFFLRKSRQLANFRKKEADINIKIRNDKEEISTESKERKILNLYVNK